MHANLIIVTGGKSHNLFYFIFIQDMFIDFEREEGREIEMEIEMEIEVKGEGGKKGGREMWERDERSLW